MTAPTPSLHSPHASHSRHCHRSHDISRSAALAAILVAAMLFFESSPAQAAVITLTASDASTNNSFVNSGGWSVVAAPAAGNTYENVGYTMYGSGAIAPSSAIAYGTTTFAGDSLTLGDGTTAGTVLALRWLGAINVPNLIVNNASIQNYAGNFTTPLAGNMTILAGGATIRPTSSTARIIAVNAAISGVGALAIFEGTVSLNNATNSYSGGTTIGTTTHATNVTVTKDGALGLGNVSIAPLGNLDLNSGTLNNYIANTASLLLSSSLDAASITLGFSGADTIAALSFDGGSTFASLGTWGAVGSGADHESSVFSGTGMLNVVPEPSTWALLASSLTTVMVLRRRRRE